MRSHDRPPPAAAQPEEDPRYVITIEPETVNPLG
jgi:hypothetical protein